MTDGMEKPERLPDSEHMACPAGDATNVATATPARSVSTHSGPDQRQNTQTQMDAETTPLVDRSEGVYICPACALILPNSRELTNHLRGHNSSRSTDCSGEEEYSCRVCHKVLSSASSLDRHILVHSGERPFECRLCGLAFTTNGNMHRHIRTAHGGSPFNSCTDSDGSSDSDKLAPKRRRIEVFNNNNRTKRKSPDYIDDRDVQRKHKILLNNSRSVNRNVLTETQRTHPCPICNRQDFATGALLKSHLLRKHPEVPARCDSCNLSFKNYRVLNEHRFIVHHPERSIDSPTRYLRNSVVGFEDLTFVDFSSDKFPAIARAVCEQSVHRPASGEIAKFQCNKCLRAFPCRAALDSHETDCGNPNFQARVPGDEQSRRDDFFAGLDLQNKAALTEAKEGKDLADIQSIISVTSGPILQNFPRSDTSTPDIVNRANSNIGSSGSSGPISSDNHEEEVQDAFPVEFRLMKLRGEFPCRLCSAVFPNLRALKGHNRAHMGVGPGVPYPCNMCSYTSTDKAALVKHLRSHNGDRPYECSLCNYAFTTKANCERHLRNRHGKLTREDVKRSIIYHPNEDPLNDSSETPPRGAREDTRRSLMFCNDREELSQHYPQPMAEVKTEIRVIDEGKLCPSEIPTRHPHQMYHFQKPDIFSRPPTIQPLGMAHRTAQAIPDMEKPQDLAMKPCFSRNEEDVDITSDGTVSLVSETKAVMHQRIQDAPINLKKPSNIPISLNEDAPLDLSMDALDLRKKSKVEESEPIKAPEEYDRNPKDLYNVATNQFLLTQALLKAAQGPQPPSLDALYAHAHTLYRNFGPFPAGVGADLLPPYLFNPHLFGQDFSIKDRLQKEIVRGQSLTSGGILVKPHIGIPGYGTPYPQSRDVSSHSTSEDNDHSSKQMSPKVNSKQKQRRYRTERPFACEHCSARFTLRSNMERHVKQQHPQYWRQRQRGGHSARGRPPTNPSTLLQNIGQPISQQLPQHYQNILPKMRQNAPQDYGKHSISDQVKYAILTQQLKGNKVEEKDSEEEKLVIDEESLEEDTPEPLVKNKQPLSLLRGKLEDRNDFNRENIMKQHVNDFSKEYLVKLQEQHLERLKLMGDSKPLDVSQNTNMVREADDSPKEAPIEEEQMDYIHVEEMEKNEDGAVDLASVSKLLDNASQQYHQFQPQYLSDEEEGLVASTSEGNNSGSDEKSDSGNSESVPRKKKSAYSLAPNRVSCPYCRRKFPWTSSLTRHILTHTGQKPFKCIYCPLLFTTKSNCDRHLLRKHVNASSNQTQPPSATSQPSISNPAVNSNAFAMRNVPERPHKCKQCPSSTFSTLGNLKKHLFSKHSRRGPTSRPHSPLSERQSSPSGSSKQNDQSDYDSPSSSVDESVHASMNLQETPRATPSTSSTIDTPQSLKSSPECGSTVSTCSSELPFKCHLCDGSFAERQDCLEHIKYDHSLEYKLLLTKGALDMAAETETHPEDQQHMSQQQQIEDGEGQRGKFPDYANRKVVCAYCMRRFWSAEDLRRHMRTHTGERPFFCDVCGRRFTLKHSMLRHRKKHDVPSPPKCPGTSGDEAVSPTTPIINNNNNTMKSQEVSGNATPVRFGSHEKLAGLTGKLPSLQNNKNIDVAEDNDLISNLLGIRDKSIIDRMLQASADDAAKLLGVKRSHE